MGAGKSRGTGQTTQPVNVVNVQPIPVQVTNQAQPPSAVTVNNTAAQPVPIVDPKSEASAQPWGYLLGANFASGASTAIASYTVPAGSRIMLRHLSGSCQMPTAVPVVMSIGGNPGLAPFDMALQTMPFSPTLSRAVGTYAS